MSAQAFKVGQGFNILYYLDPVRPALSWLNETVLNWRLYNLIKESIDQDSNNTHTNGTATKTKPARSVINLAVADLDPTPALIKNTISQLKTFLFAGQDTTATLIQWLLFELAKCANVQPYDPLYTHYKSLYKALLEEHNTVFDPRDPFSALHQLASQDESQLTSKLPVTNAWVKEALRLHPPASSARWAMPAPFTDTNPPFEVPVPTEDGTGERMAVINGLRVYNCQWLIQRHPDVWSSKNIKPDEFDPYGATLFNPHRWLDAEYMSQIPVGAFRAFERGPRNCVGQTLATFEAVAVLCCVGRGFVFEKSSGGSGLVREVSGDGGDGKGGEKRYELEPEVVKAHRVTSVVSDGMKMRVRLRETGA